MRNPLPKPLYDVVDWGSGGISLPSISKIIDNLGFKDDYTERSSRKTPFHKKKIETLYEHKLHKGLTMVFYDYKDIVDFHQDDKLLFSYTSLYDCHINTTEIIRKISLSKLI